MRSRNNSALVVVAVLLGIGEFVNAFFIAAPLFAAFFGLLFLLGAWLVRADKPAGAMVIGTLCLLELVFLPGYPRHTVSDWLVQAAFAVGSLLGLALAVRAVAARSRATSTA